MSKLILGSFLAALVMFIFGAVFWMSPYPYAAFSHATDDQAAGQALLQHFPETGNYIVPGMSDDKAKLESLHTAGPVAFVALQREGGPVMDPKYLGLGFLQYFVVMLLAGTVLRRAASALPSYGSRLGVVTLIGVIVGIMGDLAMPVWWSAPWAFFVVLAAYGIVSTMLGGLVLAKFVK